MTKKHMYIDRVWKMYYEDKMSLSEISEIIPASVQSMSRWFKEEGWQLEDRKRNPNAGRTAAEQEAINEKIRKTVNKKVENGEFRGGRKKTYQVETRTCSNPNCAETFDNDVYSDQRFCSRTCARSVDNTQRSEDTRDQYLSNPKRCPCGSSIPYEKRHGWKYCSDSCRKEYGGYRKTDPENYTTFNCRNCGTEVTRYKRYRYHRYCSNACACRHTKTRRHYGINELDVVFDSNYEVFYWGYCSMKKIAIERFNREEGVEWKPDCWYAPDFKIWEDGRWVAVEIKGIEDSDDQTRWKAFRESWGPLKVLSRDDLLELVL